MIKVVRKNGEGFESLYKRFKKQVAKSNILQEVEKKRWFVSESEQRRLRIQRRKSKKARK